MPQRAATGNTTYLPAWLTHLGNPGTVCLPRGRGAGRQRENEDETLCMVLHRGRWPNQQQTR
jgi:hypothetical protein